MDHELSPAAQATRDHLAAQFPDAELTMLPPTPGPISGRMSLHVARLKLPRFGWIYATTGLWDATQKHGHALEFVLYASIPEDDLHVETLTMTAWYHALGGDHELGLGHTVPIGRPWLPGSSCDHLLVSLPYPWGPELEECELPGGHARVLWLLPITEAEKIYRHQNDLEALEQRLEDAEMNPVDPHRASVVSEDEIGGLPKKGARRFLRRFSGRGPGRPSGTP
ncbi:hypothetical protein Q0Z83_081070 [Actinoplanes sichuanensis]|uniref:Suppressor of fused domain protein n=1 Tax=Actinoplanes sichuanensis TaxID=512349 RepID=A0ABW4AEB7_9ACTN|nr:suppressor of fused domain protein [Actinoplanes sichuanensis]BEL09916.1 hypothetical protein Q0Z83_081070 [Actinoplanes sichuanensis]